MRGKGKKAGSREQSEYYPNGLPEHPSRLAIFQCYDKEGIIDDYIPYLLNDLKENLTELVVVVNGKLTPVGRRRLASLTPHIFVRADEGYDNEAWKEAMIDYLGWDKIAEYDELILLNDSFFGPLYPFREMFEEMDRRPVDFWGITAHGRINEKVELCPYEYVPAHIQSYFIAIRKEMHTSYEFKHFWEQKPLLLGYQEGVYRHEVVFTEHFKDKGFVWNVFVDTSDIDGDPSERNPTNNIICNSYELIKNRRCPVVMRKCFGEEYSEHLNSSSGAQVRWCVEYIKSNTKYDVSLIFKNIARTYNAANLYCSLHLNFILPKTYRVSECASVRRAVVVFHITYMDMLDYLHPYVAGLPESVDVILTTKPEENVALVYEHFSPLLGDRLRVVPAKDPGRDISALLITAKQYLKDYDYIGFCHDKKSIQFHPLIAQGFQEAMIENILGSGFYVENVIDLLDKHPEIGFLSSPWPMHGPFFETTMQNRGWTVNFKQTKKLAGKLQLSIDMSKDKWALALGTSFWCRRDALAPLLDYPWSYEDFPREPAPVDGTVGHAVERIFPFVAQHQGYLSGWVMTDEYASLELTNIMYRYDQLVHGAMAEPPIGVKGALVIYIKKHLPKRFWSIARKIKHLLRW